MTHEYLTLTIIPLQISLKAKAWFFSEPTLPSHHTKNRMSISQPLIFVLPSFHLPSGTVEATTSFGRTYRKAYANWLLVE